MGGSVNLYFPKQAACIEMPALPDAEAVPENITSN
jgi:hypothetical protein